MNTFQETYIFHLIENFRHSQTTESVGGIYIQEFTYCSQIQCSEE